jgi:nucleotide-binding universal stress UspA family protein
MKRILVAYDGGAPAQRALATGIKLAKQFGASISVVSVIPSYAGRIPTEAWDDGAVHANQLQEARDILAANGLEAELLEPSGDPAKAIERVVEVGGFDTVVLGSRGLGAISRFLQRSVSEHVATHTKATVVISR